MDVSIVVPFFNAGPRIEKCARALFAQAANGGVQLVFVDDGSTDGSADAVAGALGDFPSLKDAAKFVRLDANGGVTAARLAGVAAADGEFVSFCDADDEPEPGFYDSMLAKARESGADVVVAPATVVWPDGETRVDDMYPDVDAFFRAAFHTTYFNALWNKLFRRETIAPDGMALPAGRMDVSEDLLIVSQALLRCRSIAFSRGPSYRYIMSDSSICGKWRPSYITDQIETARLLEGVLPERLQYCVRHLRHRIQSNALRFGGLDARSYAALWPEERSLGSLRSDRLLRKGTAAAIWLSGFAPSAAMPLFSAAAGLRDRLRGRRRDA